MLKYMLVLQDAVTPKFLPTALKNKAGEKDCQQS